MGTRSITHIHEMEGLGDEEIVCSFFRHWDGYPEGHGQDILNFVEGKRLVNGIGSDFEEGVDFNRAGTFAVPFMQYIQNESGCEVIPTGAKNYGEEYTYHVYFRNGKFQVMVEDWSGNISNLRDVLREMETES